MEGDVAADDFSLPKTRDVLGAHLHQKVSEALSGHFTNAKKMVSDGSVLADKMTGMLLERSPKDILAMLQDGTFLLKNLKMALEVLHKTYPESLQTTISDRLEERHECSLEEIGEVLFERVSRTEELLAAQITGMIMELDSPTLLQMINSDGPLLESAIEKAKEVLVSVTNLTEYPPGQHSPPESTLTDVSCHSPGELQHTTECLAEQIYEQVVEVHADCASDLTGMILELEPQVIRLLLQDKQKLELAIAKAYTEWMKYS